MTETTIVTEAAAPATKELPASTAATAKLTDNDIKWRAKYKVTKDELETVRAQTEKEKQELASKFDATHKEKQSVEKRWIEAEVKAQAVAAGIKDLDFIKLIDIAALTIGENGIEGLQKTIEDFKAKKPDLFGAEKKFSSSTNAPFPSENKVTTTNARDMTNEEFAKAKMQIMTGTRPY